MSEILRWIQILVERNQIRISAHGYDELAEDGILARDVIGGIFEAILVEEYPDFHKGPAVLVLQMDSEDAPIQCIMGHTNRPSWTGSCCYGL